MDESRCRFPPSPLDVDYIGRLILFGPSDEERAPPSVKMDDHFLVISTCSVSVWYQFQRTRAATRTSSLGQRSVLIVIDLRRTNDVRLGNVVSWLDCGDETGKCQMATPCVNQDFSIPSQSADAMF